MQNGKDNLRPDAEMVGAIILAAGESRRMGSPKPLLPLGRTTFLAHVLGVLEASRARPIVVVLGHEAKRVRQQVPCEGATVVFNPEYRKGMLSSIRAGLKELAGETVTGALLCPVDHPLVRADLVNRLIRRFEETGRPIVLPVYHGRRGHPVLFARSVFEEIERAPESVGARRVVWDHKDEVLEVAVVDPGVTYDIDTPSQYRKLATML